jgi:hypothetical protein
LYKISKTTKRNIELLKSILRELERADLFIKDQDIVICKHTQSVPINNQFVPKDPTYWEKSASHTVNRYGFKENSVLQPITKEFGSDLCGLNHAITSLKNFIEKAGQE